MTAFWTDDLGGRARPVPETPRPLAVPVTRGDGLYLSGVCGETDRCPRHGAYYVVLTGHPRLDCDVCRAEMVRAAVTTRDSRHGVKPPPLLTAPALGLLRRLWAAWTDGNTEGPLATGLFWTFVLLAACAMLRYGGGR